MPTHAVAQDLCTGLALCTGVDLSRRFGKQPKFVSRLVDNTLRVIGDVLDLLVVDVVELVGQIDQEAGAEVQIVDAITVVITAEDRIQHCDSSVLAFLVDRPGDGIGDFLRALLIPDG